jgi:thiamine pyrophosphate-dependent acetolactate synthase large subunit-like protein
LALNLLKGEGYLGVAGSFSTDTAARLMGEADVVIAAGASLIPFTRRFGHLLGPDSTVIQCVPANGPKRVPVQKTKMRHSCDAHQTARRRSLRWREKEADDDTQCRRRPPFMPPAVVLSPRGAGP